MSKAMTIGLFLATAGLTRASASEVSGTVRFDGKAPAPEPLKVTQDHDVCGQKPLFSESLLVSAKGELKNAVVWLEGVPGKPAPADSKREANNIVLNNTGCHFVPHVQGALVGARIDVKNSDDVLHNTHARQGHDRLTVFNVGLPILGQVSKQKLGEAGLVKVGCDAGHTWMSAFIYVFDHPWFAVTGADGSFTIRDVPAGTWKAQVWHETLGTQSATVTVPASGAGELKVTFRK